MYLYLEILIEINFMFKHVKSEIHGLNEVVATSPIKSAEIGTVAGFFFRLSFFFKKKSP